MLKCKNTENFRILGIFTNFGNFYQYFVHFLILVNFFLGATPRRARKVILLEVHQLQQRACFLYWPLFLISRRQLYWIISRHASCFNASIAERNSLTRHHLRPISLTSAMTCRVSAWVSEFFFSSISPSFFSTGSLCFSLTCLQISLFVPDL